MRIPNVSGTSWVQRQASPRAQVLCLARSGDRAVSGEKGVSGGWGSFSRFCVSLGLLASQKGCQPTSDQLGSTAAQKSHRPQKNPPTLQPNPTQPKQESILSTSDHTSDHPCPPVTSRIASTFGNRLHRPATRAPPVGGWVWEGKSETTRVNTKEPGVWLGGIGESKEGRPEGVNRGKSIVQVLYQHLPCGVTHEFAPNQPGHRQEGPGS